MEVSMALNKQAKVLSTGQVQAILGFLATTRHPDRNRAIFLLSAKAGLRAKEIACLKWEMVTDAEDRIGTAINLTNIASKGKSGRVIPLGKELLAALARLQSERDAGNGEYVITTERSARTSPAAVVNLFKAWYQRLGFKGCSSHSGRRSFITNAARKISTVGGSLRDIQMLAGHAALSTTQRYIEADVDAQRRIVELV
jgi:integrase